MKITFGFLVLALYASSSAAILGFGKSAYNKWHETELERWLSDHDIPYPTPADRKELENLVKEHWDSKVSSPYKDWDTARLQAYLNQKGVEITDKSKENKNWLIETVKNNWYEAENVAEDAYENVKSWIFDTWTDSQLKTFLDRHGIQNPTPRKRDTMLQTARDNYQVIADKVGETAAYPGNWLYEAWSESELKKWLDERGIPVPQPTTRDRLIAQVRRNSRTAALKLKEAQASASKSAEAVKESITDTIFDSWSDSELKNWCDKNGIKVPQGSTRNELIALARRNKAYLSDDTVNASISAYYNSATNTAASAYSKATDTISDITQDMFDKAIELWSDTRLKAYLDSRGVPVPQNGKRDELLSRVRLHRHKIANGYGTWTFDTWTYENLKKFVDDQANKGANAASAAASTTRGELLKQAQKAYDEAKSSGGSAYASVTSAMAKATDSVRQNSFERWSDSDLKNYLDSYGIKTYQGTTRNEMLAKARRAQHLFWYGTATPTETMYEKVKNGAGWLYNRVAMTLGFAGEKAEGAADSARESAQYVYDRGAEKSQEAKQGVKDKAKDTYDRAYEEGQKAYHKGKEEL
ncbi:putative stress response protein ish1 [Tirmania nivea]|nr:putative stress response protein ish1 [Tirmania nivea]